MSLLMSALPFTTHPATPAPRAALRRMLLAQRYAMTQADIAAQTAHLHQQVLERFSVLPRGSMVALYAPHAGEADVLCLAQQLCEQCPQHTLCLPVVVGKDQALQFAQWSAGEPLVSDTYGIAVPAQKNWVTPTVLLIPCVGYCIVEGKPYRLGYGGGYYDRSLAALRSCGAAVQAIGVAWRNAQCVFTPTAHDVPMDRVFVGSLSLS
jgi:5-formyltetrahydrofolate cyclo-ligase